MKASIFKFQPFSKKQRKVLTWWTDTSPVNNADGVIADGAIRSGKSICMSLAFVIWAMDKFDNQNFAMCGKSVSSFRRNVLFWLKMMVVGRGYKYEDKRSENLFIIHHRGKINYFHIFGGRDERSQDFVQGMTLAGAYLDEVAIMPQSFVNQVTGRCSVEGSKLWFNCNPNSPAHWFKVEWIDKAEDKNLLYIHFTMKDNLSLSEAIKQRYYNMYSGVFFKRYIEGLWALAEGIIYPKYDEAEGEIPDNNPSEYCLSIDYGTMNAFAALLWEKHGKVWYASKGYYYSGREQGITKTDEEYAEALDKLIAPVMEKRIEEYGDYYSRMETIIDPSAASFIALLKKRQINGKKWYKVKGAYNAVMDGIRVTDHAMRQGLFKISKSIKEWFKEAGGYVWDEKATEDKPVKVNDHYMDCTRYFVKTKNLVRIKQTYEPRIFKGE